MDVKYPKLCKLQVAEAFKKEKNYMLSPTSRIFVLFLSSNYEHVLVCVFENVSVL